MERLNRYYRCSKISERKTRQIIRYFAPDLTASKTAELGGLTRRTVTLFIRVPLRVVHVRDYSFSSFELVLMLAGSNIWLAWL